MTPRTRSLLGGLIAASAFLALLYLRLYHAHALNEEPRHASSAPAKVAPVSSPAVVRENSPGQVAVGHAPSPPALVADAPLATIARFDAWFTAFRRGERPSIAEGLRLARERRAALKELIVSDPREALARALPRPLRAELPSEIRAELETPIDAFARYEVVAGCHGPNTCLHRWAEIDGRRYAVQVFGRRLATLSKHRLPVHGIALDDQLAIDEAPFRRLESGESDAPGLVTGTDVVVAVGDRVQAFGSPAALQVWAAKVENAEAVPDPEAPLAGPQIAAASAGWTFGEKSVLWIRADFSDEPGLPATDSDIQAVMTRVSDYFLDVSNARSSFRTVIVPGALRLSKTMAVSNTDPLADTGIRAEAVALARAYDAASGNTGLYDPDRHDRWIVVTKRLSVLGLSGRGVVGAAGVFLNGTISATTVAHELGHNHGLHHADGWRPSGASHAGAGAHASYGDVFDLMGSGIVVPGAHFSSKAKEILLYLEAAHTPTITTAGTYRIFRHDDRDASGTRGLRIPAGGYEYWVEHRQLAPTATFTQTARLRDGVLIMWSKYPPTLPGRGTYLLDATPNSPPGVGSSPGSAAGFDDAPFVVGATFADPERGINITPTARGGAAPNEWVDVRVDFSGGGTVAENRNPVLAVTLPFTVLPVRTDLAFTATGSDPDGDPVGFRWDFGDGQPPMSGATVVKRFPAGGSYTLRCTALDGRGGSSTKSLDLTIDDPLRTPVQRGQGVTTLTLYAIVHDGRQFITAGSPVVLTSPDGVAWTRRQSPANETYLALATSGARTVAVGVRPVGSPPATFGALASSADGVTWLSSSSSLQDMPQLTSVAYGAGRFVVAGHAGTVLQSSDGVNWTRVASGVTQHLLAIHFAANRFVATGNNGVIITSVDGITWQNRSLVTSSPLMNLAHHRDTWLAGSGLTVWASTNGLDWTGRGSAFSGTLGYTSLGSSGILFSSSANDIVHLSEDGVAWSSFPFVSPATTGSVRAACFADGKFVAVATGGRIYTSTTASPAAVAPEVTADLQPQRLPAGQDGALRVEASGTGIKYHWLKDGVAIAGATDATLVLSNPQPAASGNYSVTIANFGGTVTNTAAVTIDSDTARLANLSIRTRAGTEPDVLTIGFVVARSFFTGPAGASPKRLLARGIGPTLGGFGVSDVLADPRIDVFRGSGRIDGNDDWASSVGGADALAGAFSSVGAFPLPANSKDAALLGTYAPEGYTVQLTGAGNASGVALAELYDLDERVDGARLVNVSARSRVGSAADALIAGFALTGSGTRTLLIRATGPTLAAFGVSGTLGDPILQIRSGDVVLSENDDWNDAPAIAAAAGSVGAFSLLPGSKDAAVLLSLPAGSYTAQVVGMGGAIGVALIEIYEVPPSN